MDSSQYCDVAGTTGSSGVPNEMADCDERSELPDDSILTREGRFDSV